MFKKEVCPTFYDNQEEYAVWNRIYYNEPDIEGKIIIPVQVQMNYKAAHILKDIPVRLTLRAFMIGRKKRPASPSSPYILTSEPLFRHHSHSCFRTDISIVRHASLTRWLRDYNDHILIFFSVSCVESVTRHAADNANGTNG